MEIIREKVIIRDFVGDDYPLFYKRLCCNPGFTNTFHLWNLRNEKAELFFEKHLMQYKEPNVSSKGYYMGIFTHDGDLIGTCGIEYNKFSSILELFMGLEEASRFKGYGTDVFEGSIQMCKNLNIYNVNIVIPELHPTLIKIADKSDNVSFQQHFDLKFNGMDIKMRKYLINR
ncbi:MAG: GNAT family N-acetyltransferase [Anaeroplasmataceae bacterium]